MPAKYFVSSGVAQRTSDSGACLGENAIAFHSDLARRQSYGRDVALRLDERPNNLPAKVRL